MLEGVSISVLRRYQYFIAKSSNPCLQVLVHEFLRIGLCVCGNFGLSNILSRVRAL